MPSMSRGGWIAACALLNSSWVLAQPDDLELDLDLEPEMIHARRADHSEEHILEIIEQQNAEMASNAQTQGYLEEENGGTTDDEDDGVCECKQYSCGNFTNNTYIVGEERALAPTEEIIQCSRKHLKESLRKIVHDSSIVFWIFPPFSIID